MPQNPESIWRKDRDHFLHPWTHFDSFKEDGSLVMGSGEGCYVYDLDGKRYLDGIAGLWCVNVGHGNDEMADAIGAQARKLAQFNTFVDISNQPAAELAAKLAELAPGDLNHVFFTTGGSTAVDTAYRLCQFYHYCRGKPGKRHVISRRDAYHGSTFLTISLGGKAADRIPEFEFKSDTIHHVSSPNPYRRPVQMSEQAFCDFLVQELEDKILEIGPGNTAAFFAEPIMGAGGVIVPPAGYLKRIAEVCSHHDVLLVIDEVVTAFGRLGHMFASKSVFDIEPDILICAKGLTSGYQPLGAALFSSRIYDVISAPNPHRVFAHGFTYSGHPVACAAALKNIEIIGRDDLCGHVRRVGPYFEQQLATLHDLPIVGDVRGSQFMMCIEMVADKQSKQLFADEVNIGKLVADHAEDAGLLVRPIVHLNILSPPLVMTRVQVDFIVKVLRNSIELTLEDLRRRGIWTG